MKTRENSTNLTCLKSILFHSHIFLFFLGFVSAFGTQKSTAFKVVLFLWQCRKRWVMMQVEKHQNGTAFEKTKIVGFTTVKPTIIHILVAFVFYSSFVGSRDDFVIKQIL